MGHENTERSAVVLAYSEERLVESNHYSPQSSLLVLLSLVALSWLLLGITLWASA
jgi:hypothetical protein